MNQYQAESRLSYCYAALAGLLTICVICIAVPYNHWRVTLDVCPGSWRENTNCGCIFYGLSTFQSFNGGHNSYCLYAIIAPLPVIAYAVIMALFHTYRVCLNVGRYEDTGTKTMEEIEGESIVVTTRTRVATRTDAIIYCWIPSACIAAVITVYSIVHAGIITDGFLKTCTQYRNNLVTEIHASGEHARAIHFRLPCQAIYDLMDFLVKDAPNSRRGEYINTGASLHIALITAWVSVCLWVFVAVLSSVRAYKERNVLTCCGH